MDFRYVPVILDNKKGLFEYVVVYQYWQDLITAGLLKYRIPDVKNASIQNVIEMLYNPQFCHIAVWDTEEVRVAGECALYFFHGRSAMMHYSVHPRYHGGEDLIMCREALQQIFEFNFPPLGEKLTTICGLSPITNKLSINFLKKIGFSVKCTLTDSFILAYRDNKVVDGVLVQIHREDMKKWVETK